MDQRVRERQELERALLEAVEADRIEPHFRPTIDLRTGQVVAFEVTPSWKAKNGQALDPDRFLAIAEETGLIHTIGVRLVQKACIAASAWPSGVRLSLDLLPGQILDPKLGEVFLGILATYAMSPERLELEIAENIVVTDLEGAKTALAPLRAAGVKVTLDNFGTGYSSLYHMQEFQFDKVKIDRRFTDRLGEAEADRVIKALAGLGHGLGLIVSAEAAARTTDRVVLLESGVEQGQHGHDFLSAPEAAALFKNSSYGIGLS